MKKVLLGFAFINSFFFYGQVQNVLSEDFNSMTLGNLGTDFTGATAGQNGWLTQGTSNADFQVANVDVSNGKSLKLTSGNGFVASPGSNAANDKFAYKGFSTTAYATNNITRLGFKIYTGPATGSGRLQGILYSSTGTIGGIFYDYATKTIKGLARVTVVADPSQGGILTLNLGTHVFPANSWVTVLYSYNKTTGSHTFAYSDGTATNSGSYGFSTGTTYATVTGLIANEADIVNTTSTGNTVANIAYVDNINAEFTNQTLLSVDDVKKATVDNSIILIYPNPTTEVLNIKTNEKIKFVSIYDLTGRRIEAKVTENKVDVRNLQNGTYIIKVETINGITSEKFIKK